MNWSVANLVSATPKSEPPNQLLPGPDQEEHGQDLAYYISMAFENGVSAIRHQRGTVEQSNVRLERCLAKLEHVLTCPPRPQPAGDVGHGQSVNMELCVNRLEHHLQQMESRVLVHIDSLSKQQGRLEEQFRQSDSIGRPVEATSQAAESSLVKAVHGEISQQLESQNEQLAELLKISSNPKLISRKSLEGFSRGYGSEGSSMSDGCGSVSFSRPKAQKYGRADSFHEEMEETMTKRKDRVEHDVSTALAPGNQTTSFDFHLATLSKIRDQHEEGRGCCGCLNRVFTCRHTVNLPASTQDWHPFRHFVHGSLFSGTCAGMILAYALYAGAEANLLMNAAWKGEEPPAWIDVVGHAFNVWFFLEMVVRICVDGLEFFHGREWRWNCFDLALVLYSSAVSMFDGLSVGFFRLLRMFKILRAVRIVRVFRMFKELKILVSTILSSLASLFWSLAFLCVVTYLCSILFMQGATTYILEQSTGRANDTVSPELHRFFDSMPQSMYFLVAAITGGVDWTDVAWPLWHMSPVYGMCFTGYVLISIFGILNIVTAIFVERASNVSRIDRDFAISDEISRIEGDIQESLLLFHEVDVDASGNVPIADFMEFLTNERALAYFATLGIDITNRKHLRTMFDVDGNDFVTLEEFVLGCVRLRGSATKSDYVSLMHEMKKILDHMDIISKQVISLVRQVNQHGDGLEALHELHTITQRALGVEVDDIQREFSKHESVTQEFATFEVQDLPFDIKMGDQPDDTTDI